jgi:hypothetical protein
LKDLFSLARKFVNFGLERLPQKKAPHEKSHDMAIWRSGDLAIWRFGDLAI